MLWQDNSTPWITPTLSVHLIVKRLDEILIKYQKKGCDLWFEMNEDNYMVTSFFISSLMRYTQ